MSVRKDFSRHMQKETQLPVYALISPSSLLRDEAVQSLVARLFGSQPQTLNRSTLSGITAGSVMHALAEARTLPWGAAKRLVVLTDLHKVGAKEHPALIDYLHAPCDSAVVLLVGEKCDMRTKLGGALSKANCLFSFELPRPQELPNFVNTRAAAMNMRIEPYAARLLAELCGADLQLLLQSLQKAALYAGAGQVIDEASINAVVTRTKHESVFAFTDAVAARDPSRASMLLHRLLDDGEAALLLVAMLARQTRQLLVTKSLPHASTDVLAQTLGVRPFVAETLLAQAARFSLRQLVKAHAAIAAADRACKSSRLPHALLLDRLMLAMMS